MICFKNSSTDVYFNLALDEYLLKSDIKDNIFFLWKNFNTIVIGQNQNTIEEINLQAVEADKVNVARRITGGGAVYQDDGNLCFSIIVNKDDKIAKNYESILQPIINVLQKLGLNAKFAGKNDIEIDGKKISGNAQIKYKNRLLHHGTFLFDVDLSKMQKYLNVSQDKIISKGIKSIPARVTNIRPLLVNDITINEFMLFITNEFLAQGTPVLDLPPDIIVAVNKLADEKYRKWEWNFGNSPEFSYQNKIRYEGKGTVDVRLNVTEGKITKIKFFGDFLGSGGTEPLETLLTGCEYNLDKIKTKLLEVNIKDIFGEKFETQEVLDVIFT
ncbi:lipoate--protein ligase [Spiroplasma citri]|uniref:lipoate--protein ligase n=1 Tax=Spiroplasma citri TaxID=2133 RepID=A0AAX3SZU3_SPICI|nr:lipoate--protein ligase [Spiroplasma citri]WFG96821.1 lipoate--protein ligase [Spiroplasma citri]WFH00717.1 lipoate--protein ligase [Spiroplasma citri]